MLVAGTDSGSHALSCPWLTSLGVVVTAPQREWQQQLQPWRPRDWWPGTCAFQPASSSAPHFQVALQQASQQQQHLPCRLHVPSISTPTAACEQHLIQSPNCHWASEGDSRQQQCASRAAAPGASTSAGSICPSHAPTLYACSSRSGRCQAAEPVQAMRLQQGNKDCRAITSMLR